jgi:hypothetical protein
MSTSLNAHLAQHGFREGFVIDAEMPVPLVGEHMRIKVRNGVALVSREQIFRNTEKGSIEATLTFPVPVHATLHRLAAKIGERTLNAVAKRCDEARENYEEAIDQGKTTVLHEEKVRGVHILSVAHIPPGAEIAVTHAWVAPLMLRGHGRWLLRVPVTVGDIYGNSPFGDADDLVTSNAVVHEADVEVDAGSAVATIRGSASAGRTRLKLDGSVDIEITGIESNTVRGIAADGRGVVLSVTPDPGGDAAIDAAIVVDRSGSMRGAASELQNSRPSKHDVVIAGLLEASRTLRPTDRAELWQFDNTSELVGKPGAPLAKAIARLGAPRGGGTDIGHALSTVIAASTATDIVLITDGLSYALDIQVLANSGRRFTVVPVGADSLEANVGYLAALTGGQIVLVTGSADAAEAISAAVASTRRGKLARLPGKWPLASAAICANGAIVEAKWGTAASVPAGERDFAIAVGAMAAAMALPQLVEDDAARVAEEHGIVCHLTSLVLVDEAGAQQEGLPGQRKVALMRPAVRTANSNYRLAQGGKRGWQPHALQSWPNSWKTLWQTIDALTPHHTPGVAVSIQSYAERGGRALRTLAEAAARINWSNNPEALRQGNLDGLSIDVAVFLVTISERADVLALAAPKRKPIAIAIGLAAQSIAKTNRAAARVARAILGKLDKEAVRRVLEALAAGAS